MFEFDEEFMQMDAEYRQLKSDLDSSASDIGDWKVAKIYEYRMAGLEDPYDFDDDNKLLTTTKTGTDASDAVNVKIWIEGWEKFGSTPSAIWDTSYISQNFDLKLQFACEADYE